MDFATKVTMSAKVASINHRQTHGYDVIVLEDVYINGSYFRDHLHAKVTKRLSNLVVDDCFTATAEVILYLSVETNRLDKVGLKSFRDIKMKDMK